MPKIMGETLSEHRERVRTALFASLSELMSTRPFNKITLSDVAQNAGVGRTAVYNHFTDKEDLLLAFMEYETARYSEELTQALQDIEQPIDRLRLYVRQQALVKRQYHFPTSGPLSQSVSRGTAEHLRQHAAHIAQLLTQILQDAIAAGEIPEQDVNQVISLIHAAIMGGRPTPVDPEARAAYLSALDLFILRGVGAQVPARPVPSLSRAR